MTRVRYIQQEAWDKLSPAKQVLAMVVARKIHAAQLNARGGIDRYAIRNGRTSGQVVSNESNPFGEGRAKPTWFDVVQTVIDTQDFSIFDDLDELADRNIFQSDPVSINGLSGSAVDSSHKATSMVVDLMGSLLEYMEDGRIDDNELMNIENFRTDINKRLDEVVQLARSNNARHSKG